LITISTAFLAVSLTACAHTATGAHTHVAAATTVKISNQALTINHDHAAILSPVVSAFIAS